MSYLPQRAEFPLTLTVREILTVAADLRDLPASAVERELALCGLEKLAARTVSRLSGGERQRVALATLLLPDVALYLIDEPTANLDESGTELFIDRVGALRDRGCAVLFTSHVGSDVDRLATRAVVLRNGHIESREGVGEEDGYAVGGATRGAGRVHNGAPDRVRSAREWPRAVAARPR
jgi:ABC-type multidrug transport system ATPase subunit